uniref:Transmembrane protein 147 n=1 Tax=Syphacia muris TaxID=451379 RepID=A0A0N5AMI9_9BILA
MGKVVTLFHLCVLVLYLWGAYQDSQIISGPNLPIKGNFFSRVVWLTTIDLYIQIFYHLYSAYLSTRSASRKHSAKTYHLLSNALVLPASFAVGSLFWGLYLLNPELLIPKGFTNPLQMHSMFNHVIKFLITKSITAFFASNCNAHRLHIVESRKNTEKKRNDHDDIFHMSLHC